MSILEVRVSFVLNPSAFVGYYYWVGSSAVVTGSMKWLRHKKRVFTWLLHMGSGRPGLLGFVE